MEDESGLKEKRKKSCISTSFVENEPDVEVSKQWINHYIEGEQEGAGDQFTKKYFDTTASSTEDGVNKNEETLNQEAIERKEEDEKIEDEIKVDKVENHVSPEIIEPSGEKEREESTDNRMDDSLGTGEIEEFDQIIEDNSKVDRKFSEDPYIRPSLLEVEKEEIMESQNLRISSNKETKLVECVLSPTIGGRSISSGSRRSSDNIPNSQNPQITTKDKEEKLSPQKHPNQIRVKIYDLHAVRERYMNKTDDEVRHRYLKTIQTHKMMAGSKPVIREQKSRQCE